MSKSGRMANIELLRIIAMVMVVIMHFLYHSGSLMEVGSPLSSVRVIGTLLEMFCLVAVNTYVFISGYFGVKESFKPSKAVALLCQIWFYSLLIPLVLSAAGVPTVGYGEGSFNIYGLVQYLFPIETEHYWFATAYLAMYLFVPFLAAGMRKMKKRELQILLAMLLVFFSLEKTILPLYLATDRYGYDFGWFLCLFVAAGYIRLYGIPWLEKRPHAAGLYVLSCVLIWLLAMASNTLGSEIETFIHYANMLYTYNHLLCVTGAVSLFYMFKNLRIKEGRFAKAVRTLAPYTFGVYLLHEHVLVRYEWMKWLGVENVKESYLFVPHLLVCVLVVYAVGTAADFVRAWVFARVRAVAGRMWRQPEMPTEDKR